MRVSSPAGVPNVARSSRRVGGAAKLAEESTNVVVTTATATASRIAATDAPRSARGIQLPGRGGHHPARDRAPVVEELGGMPAVDVAEQAAVDAVAEQLFEAVGQLAHDLLRHAEEVVLLRPQPARAELEDDAEPRRRGAVRAAG